MTEFATLDQLTPELFESAGVLKRLARASRALAELKGVAASIPNQAILINTLGMQEAKDSSAIENIVTTHDELYRDSLFPEGLASPAAKEVLRYRQALWLGYRNVQTRGLITLNDILEVQAEIERNSAGFRRTPGTALVDGHGRVVYTPPQHPDEILRLMRDLERFINEDSVFDADPLIKMAIIHHQFESIHPFYDGNGRTGRILNVLYLMKEQLLEAPVLYMSRDIVRRKTEYYSLLQAVRNDGAWEKWTVYMLGAVENAASDGVQTINAIKSALLEAKHQVRSSHRFYSQDLINNLFTNPYTKIEFMARDLGVSRLTATKYLDALSADGILEKRKVGRSNYYINTALYEILTGQQPVSSNRT